MICKKCGAEIADTSKFCGYCGEVITSENGNVDESNVEQNNEIITSDSLIETMKKNPVEFGTVVDPVIPIQNDVQEEIKSSFIEGKTEQENIVSNEQSAVNSAPEAPSNDNKNNKWFFILMGIVLIVIAIGLLVFAFINSSGNSISVLEKAIANISEKGKDSASITAKLNIAAGGQSLNLSATAKIEKKAETAYDMQLTIDKTLFTDEISFYASVDSKKATAYINSDTIDMLGMTLSETPVWLNYTFELEETIGKITKEENSGEELELEDILDSKHFVLVEKLENVNHYQLIIDQELINTIKAKAVELANEELKESFADMEELKKAIKIDFYITKNNELTKIELDMSEHLTEEDSISKLAISIELKDLNNTKVEIPSEALNSTMNIETYMMQSEDESTLECGPGVECEFTNDYTFSDGFNYNSDITIDTNFGF